ncbi:MAG: hypothetical protein H6742_12725 [Alphaproteobacteria bacterium]|nr:hypothetical protein [Alphaproteobacteria bacterium]
MFPLPRRFPLSLVLALAVYLALATATVRQVGTVGEVDLSWGRGAPPAVLTSLDPPTWADGAAEPTSGDRAGPLVASQVRPIEGLALGPLRLPLMVNSYTGGLLDWPARLLFLATGSRRAVTALHVLLGALLLAGLHRFLRRRGTDIAAAVGGLVLATDWGFVFYRKVLGGTELGLLAGGLLCLTALWSRRWGGGRHGLLLFGLGAGLGLAAKATFALSLVALLFTALLMRWDRPAMAPPPPKGLWKPALALVLPLVPLLVAAVHHMTAVPAHVPSHDFPALQLSRVEGALRGGAGPAREGLANLWLMVSEPLGFFGPAYGVADAPGADPLRLLGCLLALGGVALGWRSWRDRSPADALLRFSSVYLALQLLLLWAVARDLHHLAQAAPTAAIVVGLSLDRLAGRFTPPRSPARARSALLLAAPLCLAGAISLGRTDAVVRQVTVPTFTEAGQQAIVDLLHDHDARRLLVADYESYGMLELRAPDVDAVHAWPAMATAARERRDPLPALLAYAADQDRLLLTVQASQPMAYNLRRSPAQLETAAAAAGLSLTAVGRLPGDAAVLWRVDR